MKHIILLISLSSLLFSSALSYSLPQSYYELKHTLIKKSRKAKHTVKVSINYQSKDLVKILKPAIKKLVPIIIIDNSKITTSYSYYKLFKNIKILHSGEGSEVNYIIFDDNFICISEHFFIEKSYLDEDYQVCCSSDSKEIKKYLTLFKKDFPAN